MNIHNRVLIISDVPPDPKFTAGQVLNKIISHSPENYYDLIWINQSNLSASDLPSNFKILKELRYSDFFQFLTSRPRLKKKLRYVFQIFNLLNCFMISFEIFFIARAHPSKVVWLVLQGDKPAITFLPLIHILKKKIILHQWDPIDWWLEHRKKNFWYRSLIKKICRHLENWADFNIVPSHSWQSLQTSLGLKSLRIDNFFTDNDLDDYFNKEKNIHTDNIFNVVFLGQFYSNTELYPLIKRVQSFCNKEKINLVLHYYGNDIDNKIFKDLQIMNHGFLDRNQLVKEIKNFDLALLPYPKSPEHEKTSQLSFPSKLRIYLAAGLPILSNMNSNSSPEIFLKKHFPDFHYNISSEDQDDLHKFLKECLNSYATATARKRNAEMIVRSEFSFQSEMSPFLDLLK